VPGSHGPPFLLVAVKDSCLGGLEHAAEAAEDCEGEDDVAVLRLLVVAPQEVGTDQMKTAWFLIVPSDMGLALPSAVSA
jgi:hypothetical protein